MFVPAVLFAGFLALVIPRPSVLYVAYPAIAFIPWMNLRTTKFCPSCARTIVRNPPWVTINFCPTCGKRLKSEASS